MAAGFWGLSSVGRAPALQAGGREFESLSLHENSEEDTSHRREKDARRNARIPESVVRSGCKDARRASVMK